MTPEKQRVRGLRSYQKNQRKYKNLELEELELLPDEDIQHCNKEPYKQYGWVVTSKGRIWSLNHNIWLKPVQYNNGYWGINDDKTTYYVHDLVGFYFLTEEEKRIMKLVEEYNKNVDVETEKEIAASEELSRRTKAEKEKYKDKKRLHTEFHHKNKINRNVIDTKQMPKDEERIFCINECMKTNYKDNIVIQIKETDHVDTHRIMKGQKTLEEQELETNVFDTFMNVIRNSKPDNVYCSYTEEGNREINVKLNLQGTTIKEEKVYDELEKENDREIFSFTKEEFIKKYKEIESKGE